MIIAIGNRVGKSTGGWNPRFIESKLLFWGKVSEITGGEMPNKVTGATDHLDVAGSPAIYVCPNTAPYIAADHDHDSIWFKTDETPRTVTTAELIGYDFARTLVKYDNASPYTIREIIILKDGETLTTAEMNFMRDYMDLSIWWDNTLSFHGNIKGNKPLAGQYVWVAESVVEDETAALVARMTAVSETPDAARITVIDTAIAADKTAIGFTTQYDALWLLASHGNDSALLNIIKDAHNLTLVNTPDFTIDRHYVGNGTDEALNCNYNPSTQAVKYLQDACSFGFYIRNNTVEDKCVFGAVDVTPAGIQCFLRYTGDVNYFKINSATNVQPVNTDSSGMWIFVRESSTVVVVYHNGISVGYASNSAALVNLILHLLCLNNNGTLDFFSSRQVALAFIGGVMDQTKVTAFQTIWVDGYLNVLGAKV
jgi:hypothetical protein